MATFTTLRQLFELTGDALDGTSSSSDEEPTATTRRRTNRAGAVREASFYEEYEPIEGEDNVDADLMAVGVTPPECGNLGDREVITSYSYYRLSGISRRLSLCPRTFYILAMVCLSASTTNSLQGTATYDVDYVYQQQDLEAAPLMKAIGGPFTQLVTKPNTEDPDDIVICEAAGGGNLCLRCDSVESCRLWKAMFCLAARNTEVCDPAIAITPSVEDGYELASIPEC